MPGAMPVFASDFFQCGDKRISDIGDLHVYYRSNGEIIKIGDMYVDYGKL